MSSPAQNTERRLHSSRKPRRESCQPATERTAAVRPLRSRPGSGLIAEDGARPVEIPDAFLDALAIRLASRLADRISGQFALPEASPWMTFEEAVEYTKVPAGTFRKLSADGTFIAHGGKRKIYHRQELDVALLSLPWHARR
jgi:hypothetical protein